MVSLLEMQNGDILPEWQYLVNFPKMQTNGDPLGATFKQMTLVEEHSFESGMDFKQSLIGSRGQEEGIKRRKGRGEEK